MNTWTLHARLCWPMLGMGCPAQTGAIGLSYPRAPKRASAEFQHFLLRCQPAVVPPRYTLPFDGKFTARETTALCLELTAFNMSGWISRSDEETQFYMPLWSGNTTPLAICPVHGREKWAGLNHHHHHHRHHHHGDASLYKIVESQLLAKLGFFSGSSQNSSFQ